MERSDVIGIIINSEGHIKRFLKEINVDNPNKLVFRGTTSLIIIDVAEDIDKVVRYVLDGKNDSERMRSELLNLRELTKELQHEAKQKGFSPFAYHCETIINIIDNMERFANTDILYPEIPEKLSYLFPSETQCINFVKRNYRKPANIVANAYMEEKGVINPKNNNSIHVVSTLFKYFVEPFIEKEKKESARTGFYKLFK